MYVRTYILCSWIFRDRIKLSYYFNNSFFFVWFSDVLQTEKSEIHIYFCIRYNLKKKKAFDIDNKFAQQIGWYIFKANRPYLIFLPCHWTQTLFTFTWFIHECLRGNSPVYRFSLESCPWKTVIFSHLIESLLTSDRNWHDYYILKEKAG